MNAISRKPYSFLNQMLLGFEGQYLTFNQAKQLGGNVKKGSKSSPVIFWTTGYTSKGEDAEGNPVSIYHEYARPVLKYYNVFEISDIEGIDIERIEPDFKPNDLSPIEEAERVINEYACSSSLK